jgi:hypothetical protein
MSTRTPTPLAAAGARGADASFLQAIAVHPSFDVVPDAQLIDVGHAICSALDSGQLDIDGVGAAAGGSGLTADQLVVLVASAVGAYCPEHEDQF